MSIVRLLGVEFFCRSVILVHHEIIIFLRKSGLSTKQFIPFLHKMLHTLHVDRSSFRNFKTKCLYNNFSDVLIIRTATLIRHVVPAGYVF